MMGLGTILMEFLSGPLQEIGAFAPGDVFPHLFVTGNGPGIFQYALVSSIIVTFVAGVLGSFLMMRNLALIGDGLAHVSFGGICVGLVLGYPDPMGVALAFSVIAAILIFEMQRTGILTGDASIAIFLASDSRLICLKALITAFRVTNPDFEGPSDPNMIKLIHTTSAPALILVTFSNLKSKGK